MVTGARTVLVIQEVKHYRVPFYERLASRLASDGLKLRAGAPTTIEILKGDNAELPRTYGLKVPCIPPTWRQDALPASPSAVAEAQIRAIIEQGNRASVEPLPR